MSVMMTLLGMVMRGRGAGCDECGDDTARYGVEVM